MYASPVYIHTQLVCGACHTRGCWKTRRRLETAVINLHLQLTYRHFRNIPVGNYDPDNKIKTVARHSKRRGEATSNYQVTNFRLAERVTLHPTDHSTHSFQLSHTAQFTLKFKRSYRRGQSSRETRLGEFHFISGDSILGTAYGMWGGMRGCSNHTRSKEGQWLPISIEVNTYWVFHMRMHFWLKPGTAIQSQLSTDPGNCQ